MSHIIAIGGGSMIEGVSAAIDKEIVKLTGKKNPIALFIPTASSEDETYRHNFKIVYGERLGCKTKELLLLNNPPSKKAIQQLIDEADIIYVGGGNTLKMMRRWRFLGVDKMLKKAFHQNKILCGSSAGALCWFQYGHSDSMAYYHPKNWDYVKVECLGLIPALLCPHYLKENRDKSFKQMVNKLGGMAIALDDASAIHIHDGNYKILSAQPKARAFKLVKRKGSVEETEIVQTNKWQSLAELLKY